MKRILFVLFLLSLASGILIAQRGAPPATGPIADLANAGIDAINKGDATYFDTRLAADVVWFDEDGHAIATKDRVLNFVKGKLLTPGKKVTISGLRVGENWAGYQYKVEAGTNVREGTQTIVYKKAGNDWQIAMVHGAVKAMAH